ncbi:MAG: UDP-glucose 4-epimerase GalE [Planctomycetes bacterium]|nr:UDP-glucose 4-epimerase GalE [Planctomycetota bacterium]
MKILVTGGAGYIGSHTLKALLQSGHSAVVVDDLRTGHASAVRGAPLVRCDIHDRDRLIDVMRSEHVEGVLHFAASCYVGVSVTAPLDYYDNNVVGTLRLAEACVAAGVKTFVFSSTCATYGEPERVPMDESTPQRPVNPYGASKWMVERILLDAARAHGLHPIFLRYFNAAGADSAGELGEDHRPETHLIPNALRVALGQLEHLEIYGNDYPTQDGTCVRDYIHVEDLASAHLLALDKAAQGLGSVAFNLGNGNGFSVLEVLEAARAVTGHAIPAQFRPRRAGDPPALVAKADRARTDLGWRPRHGALRTIVETAWNWTSKHPHGYPD